MRKLLIGVLLLTFALCSVAQATSRVLVWGSKNDAPDRLSTAVPTTTIIPGRHKIIGVSVMTLTSGNTESYCSLADTVPNGVGGTVAEVIAEAEFNSTSGGTTWFPFPITVTTMLYVDQGSYTDVLIYYVR